MSVLNANQQTYNTALNAAAVDFWNFMDAFPASLESIGQQYSNDPNGYQAAYQALQQQEHAAQRIYLLASDAAQVALVTANGQAAVNHQNAVNGIEKTKFDAYAKARETYNDAVNDANAGYIKAMAQPLVDLPDRESPPPCKRTWPCAAAAGQTWADAQALTNEVNGYDTGIALQPRRRWPTPWRPPTRP